jgi:hypothetical protein
LPFGHSKLKGLPSSHLGWRKGKQRGRARERRRVSPKQVPMWAAPAWVAVQQRMPKQLARHPQAKWWEPQARIGGMPGVGPATSETREREREREQADQRMVTLTESEERSRSGGWQWKRKANDGWESRQGSKVQNPQSRGTWGQFSSLVSGEGRTRRPRDQPQVRAS